MIFQERACYLPHQQSQNSIQKPRTHISAIFLILIIFISIHIIADRFDREESGRWLGCVFAGIVDSISFHVDSEYFSLMGFYVLPEDLVILDYGSAAGQCAQMQPDIQRFFYGGCFCSIDCGSPRAPGRSLW